MPFFSELFLIFRHEEEKRFHFPPSMFGHTHALRQPKGKRKSQIIFNKNGKNYKNQQTKRKQHECFGISIRSTNQIFIFLSNDLINVYVYKHQAYTHARTANGRHRGVVILNSVEILCAVKVTKLFFLVCFSFKLCLSGPCSPFAVCSKKIEEAAKRKEIGKANPIWTVYQERFIHSNPFKHFNLLSIFFNCFSSNLNYMN